MSRLIYFQFLYQGVGVGVLGWGYDIESDIAGRCGGDSMCSGCQGIIVEIDNRRPIGIVTACLNGEILGGIGSAIVFDNKFGDIFISPEINSYPPVGGS